MTLPRAAPSLTDLIARAQLGDPVAIAALLARTQPDIRRFARRSCRIDDVDDAVQDALVQVSRHIAALRAPAALARWLFVMVTRECIRLARWAQGKAPLDSVADTIDFAVRPEPDLRLDLAAAMEALPQHYRTIVIHRDIEEMTIDEIGAALDLSREAVKARLHRARTLLRDYLSSTP